MIDTVTNEVRQWIAELFKNGLVKFYLASLQVDFNLLAKLTGKIPDHPRKLVEQVPDRLHSGTQCRILQFGGHRIEPLDNRSLRAVLLSKGDQRLIANQRQLSHQSHQPVQKFNLNPQSIRLFIFRR